jgi:putative flippase GtrA
VLEQLSSEFAIKFIRMALVGVAGTVVDFSVTYIFKEYVKVSKYIANILGFSLAVINNYLLNRYWTFGGGSGGIVEQFGIFVGVSLVGLLINNFIIYLLNEKGNVNFYISKVMATIVVVFWNFFVNYYYTFRTSVV